MPPDKKKQIQNRPFPYQIRMRTHKTIRWPNHIINFEESSVASMDLSSEQVPKNLSPVDACIPNLTTYLFDKFHTIESLELSSLHRNYLLIKQRLSLNRVCYIILCHVRKFLSSSRDATLIDTIRLIDHLAREHREKFTQATALREKISTILINSFRPQVLRFFAVPTDNQRSYYELNQILACFLDFLLQILNSEICQSDMFKKQHCAVLEKELTYLLTFLGDEPFEHNELEEVHNILSELEILANEAGRFIYTHVFSPHQIDATIFSISLNDLLQRILRFMSKVQEHCLSSSGVISASRSSAVGSSFIIDSVIENLENMMNRPYPMPINEHMVLVKINRFHKGLTSLRSCVKDVEAQWGINKNELEDSFFQTRDVAYEAEYVVSSYGLGNVPHWYLILRLFVIFKKMKKIWERLGEIKNKSWVRISEISHDLHGELSSRDVATPANLEDNCVMGSEESRIKILGDLIGGSKNLQTISIVGMPGLGKTTLAHHMFNDRAVLDHFDYRAWCVVSETYTMRRVLFDILMNLSSVPDMHTILNMEMESLGLAIYQSLKGRRYIVVIDDVWHSSMWHVLRRYLPKDGNGSRILFTSRVKDAVPTGTISHKLPLLSETQCWNLLVKKVFLDRRCPPELENIGKEITRKCHGLPLAVVTTAGILADIPKEENAWKDVARNLVSYICSDSSDYIKVLELSYQQLPHHLKPCFLYLGVFPKGKDINLRKLTWLWIAQGFIGAAENKSLEQVAEEYLTELINKSLLEISKSRSDGGMKACRIHDLLHDMCLRRGHQDNFMKSTDDHFSIYEKHAHLLIQPTTPANWRPLGLHCRSLTSYHASEQVPCFKRMPLLRVAQLHIKASVIKQTFSHGDIHVNMRYLAVDSKPSHLLSLVNLEFLCLRHTRMVKIDFIPFLKKLSHLDVKAVAEFGEELSCSKTNLKYLSYVIIFNNSGKEIIKCSPHLRQLKCKCDETVFPVLHYLTELEILRMDFESPLNGDISVIHFSTTLKKLCLRGIGLPWEEMSSIGRLPNLQVLKLERSAFIGGEWETRDNEFKELRFLILDKLDIKHWITWRKHFPKLHCLVLRWCTRLQEIPSDMGYIPLLQSIEVSYCNNRANMSALHIEEEQREYGNEELKVIVRRDKQVLDLADLANFIRMLTNTSRVHVPSISTEKHTTKRLDDRDKLKL